MSIRSEQLDDGTHQLVIYDDIEGTKAGSLTYKRKQHDKLKICYLLVSEQYQGLGLADSLLGCLLCLAREEGFSEIIGDFTPVPENHKAAYLLYTRNGYTIRKGKIRRSVE